MKLNAERKLDSARAASDHSNPAGATSRRLRLIDNLRKLRQEAFDRLHWDGVLGRTGNIVRARGRTGINREQVEPDRGTIFQEHESILQIEPRRFRAVELRPGESAQLAQINMRLVKAVMPRDQPRQHPGIRRHHVLANQRHPRAGDRVHPKHLEHGDVRMPSSEKDNFFADRGTGTVHSRD